MPGSLLITVLGPTASGKTSFAAGLTHYLDGEIISADSRQVYRNMDLGTGKDYSDYYVEGKLVPYHLIDVVDAGYKYSVYEYQRDFIKAWEDVSGRGKLAILCGGSGMYIEAVTDAYKLVNVPHDPALRSELELKSDSELVRILSSFRKPHNISDTSSRKRLVRAIEIACFSEKNDGLSFSFPQFDNVIFGIDINREQRRKRITERLEARLREGLIEEVQNLLEGGLSPEDLIFYGLEYKYITFYITGEMTYDEMKQRLNTAIHQFAKRQMTWFRRMEKRGYKIHWLDAGLNDKEKVSRALSVLQKEPPDAP